MVDQLYNFSYKDEYPAIILKSKFEKIIIAIFSSILIPFIAFTVIFPFELLMKIIFIIGLCFFMFNFLFVKFPVQTVLIKEPKGILYERIRPLFRKERTRFLHADHPILLAREYEKKGRIYEGNYLVYVCLKGNRDEKKLVNPINTMSYGPYFNLSKEDLDKISKFLEIKSYIEK